MYVLIDRGGKLIRGNERNDWGKPMVDLCGRGFVKKAVIDKAAKGANDCRGKACRPKEM